jgi:hypothetical protein
LTAIVLAVMTSCVYGQGGDPKESLQQRLNGQFALTQITKDRSDIVSAGSALVLQKGGLMMYSTASPLPPVNTYKNGKISQGGSGFGRDLLITMAASGSATAADYPHRNFAIGEGLWVTGLTVQKDGVVFRLYSDAYDGVRYYGQLKFPFQKGSVPTPEQALTTIAEVLTVQPADTNVQGAATETPAPVPAAARVVPLKLPSTYVSAQTPADQLQLNTDNSFSLQEGGQSYHGIFVANGDTLELSINETSTKTIVTRQGNNLTDSSGQTWVLQEQSAGSAPVPVPPPAAELPSGLSQTDILAELIGIEKEMSSATIRGDKTTFERYLANDFSLNVDGRAFTRIEFLGTVSPKPNIHSYDIQNASIDFDGPIVILKAVGVIMGRKSTRSSIIIVKQTFTDRFSKIGGEWKIISSQVQTLSKSSHIS